MAYLLYVERHKHRKTLGSEGSADIQLCATIRQAGIESFKLLPTKHRHRAKVLSRTLQNALGIRVKLFLAIRTMNESDECGNHSLISRHKVVEKFSALLALTLHIIRDCRREVVVLILLSLPITDVRLDRKELVFPLPYRLIHRNGVRVDRQHKATVNIGQLCDKAILDEVGIVLEIQNSCKATVHLEIVASELKGLRGKCDLEIVSSLCIEESIISEIILISLVEEVVEHTNLIFLAHLLKLGAEL